MAYRKVSSNKYKIIIEQGYDIFGKRIRKTEIFYGTLSEVKLREAELVQEFYHKGEKMNLNNLTFKEFSNIFIEKYCKDNVSKYTRNGYEKLLLKINSIIGNIKLKEIDTYKLDNMYRMLKKGVRKKEVSNETILHYFTLINIMFNKAIKWNIVEKNPNLNANKPKKEKKERHFYDSNEVKLLLECLKKESIKYRTLITLAIDSGARRGEICALKWNDVDFENHTLLIDNSLKVINGKVDEAKPKTIYSNRVIYLSSSTINILKEYKEWQNQYISSVKGKWNDNDRIFTDKYGNHMHPDTCNKIINKVTKKYNLRKLKFHELRHTSTTLLIDSGINPKAVSERLGHANANITMNIYTHTFEDTKKECANNINSIIKST